MARVLSAAVEAILLDDWDTSHSLDGFIDDASLLVTKWLVTEGGLDETDDADELAVVEKYLAAHMYCITVIRNDSEKAGPVSEKKRSKVDRALDLTHFGQMAMVFDSTGQLAAWNESVKKGKSGTVSLTWVGDHE